MKFRLGIVGLCTSHPGNWIPAIQELDGIGKCEVEITALWDSGETRPAGYAAKFAAQMKLPPELVVDSLNAMLPRVDGVIIHTANWSRHIEQAAPFIAAGKSVLLDKPVVGNLRDASQVLDWLKQGHRITGGSSLRYCCETTELLALPIAERGEIHTVYSVIGSDEFNYGIHGYSLLCGLLGPGAASVRYLGTGLRKQLILRWQDGRIAFLTLGYPAGLPFNATVATTRQVFQFKVDSTRIYRAMLEAELPYMTGRTDRAAQEPSSFLEPEYLALAARQSWMTGGSEIFLTDLRLDDSGYDGDAFAASYRRARL